MCSLFILFPLKGNYTVKTNHRKRALWTLLQPWLFPYEHKQLLKWYRFLSFNLTCQLHQNFFGNRFNLSNTFRTVWIIQKLKWDPYCFQEGHLLQPYLKKRMDKPHAWMQSNTAMVSYSLLYNSVLVQTSCVGVRGAVLWSSQDTGTLLVC